MATTNKVTNFTVTNGTVVEVQDPHAVTLDENIDIQGTFDFGKITGYGNYNVPANALNGPTSVSVTNGVLKVIYDHDKPVQVYIHRVTNQIFVRSLGDNGSWSSWVELTSVTTLSSKLSALDTRVTNEVNARTSADKDLQSAISTEQSNRSSRDTQLENMINSVSTTLSAETNNRKSEDASLNTLISGLDTRLAEAETITKMSGVPSSVQLFSGAPISSQNTQVSIQCLGKNTARQGYYYGLIFAQGQITISNMSANQQYNLTGSYNFTLNGTNYTFQTRAIASCTSMHQYSGVLKLDYAGNTSHLYTSLAITNLTVNFSLVIPIIYTAV